MSGNPTREETEELSSIWQTGLWNSHIQSERFMLEDDRPIYLFKVNIHFVSNHNLDLKLDFLEGWINGMGGKRLFDSTRKV